MSCPKRYHLKRKSRSPLHKSSSAFPVQIFFIPVKTTHAYCVLIRVLAGSVKEAANGSRNGKTLNFIVVLLFAGCFRIQKF